MKYITFLLFYFTSLLSVSASYTDEYRFRTLSPYGGLSTDGVKSICQDKEGFVWIITVDEIFRFDGFNFKKYSGKLFKQNNTHFNSSINYRSIYRDSKKDLFLATSAGVFFYDKKKDVFSLIIEKPVTKILEDYYGDFWLVDSEITIYNKERKSSTKFYYGKEESTRYDKALFADTSGNVFFSIGSGDIAVIKGKSREIDYLYSFSEKTRIISMCVLGSELWALSESKGLFVININTKKMVKKYDFFIQDKENITPARCLFIDRNNLVWIGVQQGLHVLNPKTEERHSFFQDSEKNFSIVNSSIWTINEDDTGNIWIGTFSGGLSYLSAQDRNGINNISLKNYGFSQKAISSFAKNGTKMWFGTEGGGLYNFDENSKKIIHYSHDLANKNSLRYNNVKTLLQQGNYLWIGMYRGGIDRLNLKTGEFKNFSEKDSEKRLSSDQIVKIVAEKDSGMWVIYQSYGGILTYFSFQENISQHYLLRTEEYNETTDSQIIDMSRDDKNTLWLASFNNIFKFDTHERKCKNIFRLSDPTDSLKALRIKTIHYDVSRSCLWIGTQRHGLVRYDVEKGDVKFYNAILKFDQTAINSITSNKKGNLWLGTEVGLFYFDTKTEHFYLYDKSDGIQGPIFYSRSIFLDSNIVYVGGTEGFNYFDSERIAINKLKPRILIVDFLANGKSIYIDSNLLANFIDNNKIELSYNQNNIGFELSSSNYLMPLKNRYRYRLKGFNDEWIEVDASRRYVSYPKLPSGNYIFEAQAANNSGIWGNVQRFDIHIKPAPWNTNLAYAIYFIFISISAYFIHKEKIRRDNLKNDIYLNERRKRDQEENHQAQLRFFTNITHDFKTPLTLMLGTLDYIDKQQYKLPRHYLNSLKANSSHLLKLVNEVIDFRTSESGMMKLKLEQIDFNTLVSDLGSYMKEYAFQKNIDLKVSASSASLVNVLVDPKIIEKIILNILDNALKYTAKYGFISIETYADIFSYQTPYSYSYTEGTLIEGKEMFGFVVKDTGIGISLESISKVFNRFYRVEDNEDDPHLGSGIGLALVKSLVLQHNGFITIASERKKGTDIIVGLPVIQIKSIGEYAADTALVDGEMVDEKSFQSEFLIPQLREEKQTYNILYVEDNNSIKQLVSSFLSSDFNLTIASNGKEALSLLEEQKFDLILSDWMMPVMDGITLCKNVKGNPELSHIPFVLMTVRSGIENQLEGFGSGAEAYLEKPINFKLLQKTMFNLLNLKENFRTHFADNYFIDTKESTLSKTTNETLNKFIDIVQRRIEQEDVDFDEIALEMNMSRRKLFSFIKENTGKSIVEFVRSYKIRLAARLVVEEGLSIKEVMSRVGIDSQSHFSKAFKNEFGESPSIFLAKMRKKQANS